MAEKDSLFKNIFFAGVGALAIGADKTKELVDKFVEQGQLTVEQGRQFNDELAQKAEKATRRPREDALEARMKAMSPEEREEFARKAAEVAAVQNAADVPAQSEPADNAVAVEAEVITDDVDSADETPKA